MGIEYQLSFSYLDRAALMVELAWLPGDTGSIGPDGRF